MNCKVCLEPQHCDCLCSTCAAARESVRQPVEYHRVVENVQITFEFIHIYDYNDTMMRPTPQDYQRAFLEQVKKGQWMARIGTPLIVTRSKE